MSKADDLFEYSQYDDDIDDLHKLLKDLMNEYFRKSVRTIEDLSEEDIKELAHYFLYFYRKHGKERISYDVSIDKIKAFFLLFSKMSNDENADRILSYLEPMEAGWHDGKYYLSNSCLDRCLYSPQEYCKRVSRITDTELASIVLSNVADIFLMMNFLP